MKNTPVILILISLLSCAGTMTKNNTSSETGWIDEDTYTIIASGPNEDTAVGRAKHQILKNIVDIRVHNNSRYTDIVKIRDEFDIPLKHGTVVKRMNIPDGIEIYYQIRDKGLKKKFERK